MTIEEFNVWSKFHQQIFVLRGEGDADLVASWWDSLKSFSAADLHAATRYMAENAPPSFRDKHLHGIINAVWRRQTQRRQQELDAQPIDRRSCSLCHGIGSLTVPHIKYVVDGEWKRDGRSYHEMSVSCRCYKGQTVALKEQEWFTKKYKDNPAATPTTWTIDAYEMRVPHWPELVDLMKAALKAERESQGLAEHLDRKHGPLDVFKIKDRLAQQMDARRR